MSNIFANSVGRHLDGMRTVLSSDTTSLGDTPYGGWQRTTLEGNDKNVPSTLEGEWREGSSSPLEGGRGGCDTRSRYHPNSSPYISGGGVYKCMIIWIFRLRRRREKKQQTGGSSSPLEGGRGVRIYLRWTMSFLVTLPLGVMTRTR